MTAVADVLRAAADRLERTGKCEKDYHDRRQVLAGVPLAEARACAIGAIKDAASDSDDLAATARLRLDMHLITVGEPHVAAWSDAHSLGEVVAGLRAAADGAS